MKFSDFLFSSGLRFLSILFGTLAGGVTAVFFGWQYGVLAGAATALLFSFLLPILAFREELPYIRLKKSISVPFLLEERVRFIIHSGSVGGYFLLTEESMILLSAERGGHRLELTRKDIHSVKLGEDSGINIFLDNHRFVRVLSSYCEDMFQILRENGWVNS